MCHVFNVSKSGYYQWLQRKPSKRSRENAMIASEIKCVYKESKGRYGSPKITLELVEKGIVVSRPRVARLMRKEGLKSIIRKKYKVVTTDSKHDLKISENHLNRNFKPSQPSQAWVSDITYVPTDQGWLYLTIVMDLFDRKIIGWSLSDDMTTENTVLPAWRMAKNNRLIGKDMIFHSDRGVQYASNLFRKELANGDIIQSMSRKGNCWDNAVAENFFKNLKSELVQHRHFVSHFQAKIEIFEFIEVWYNRKRKHSHLGYMTPEQFRIIINKNVA